MTLAMTSLPGNFMRFVRRIRHSRNRLWTHRAPGAPQTVATWRDASAVRCVRRMPATPSGGTCTTYDAGLVNNSCPCTGDQEIATRNNGT